MGRRYLLVQESEQISIVSSQWGTNMRVIIAEAGGTAVARRNCQHYRADRNRNPDSES